MRGRPKSGTGRRRELWPVLVLLGLSVIVAVGCVLWFMTRAISNERLAVRQRVTDAYRAQLTAVRTRLHSLWQERIDSLARIDPARTAPEAFARIVRQGWADGAVLYDASGDPAYPAVQAIARGPAPTNPPAWSEAEELEYRRNDPAAAARSYARIARRSGDIHLQTRALQAQARCLAKSGDRDAAIELLTGEFAGDRYSLATDARGRLIQLDAFLRALELMSGPGHPEFRSTADLLAGRLDDYGSRQVPSHQRRFLMKRLRDLAPDSPALPMLEAEELSAAWLERRPVENTTLIVSPFELPGSWLAGGGDPGTARLRPTLLSHVWQMALPEGKGVVLFTQDGLVAEVEELARQQSMPPEVSVLVLPPGSEPDPDALLPSLAAGHPLPGWRIGLATEGGKLFAGAGGRQANVHLWTGALFIAGITALATLIGRHIVQQVRVARLKNDLVATVTHELKTPLSSMRMLVDTLLDGHYRDDEEKTRKYLELIARENARLSRLIDHFLTFSRMERNKKTFQFEIVPPGRIVEEAMEAIGERLASAGFEVETEIDAGLPDVAADPDAMVTVLLNLMDNAYKYSDEDRHLAVRAYRGDDGVCFQVADRGIGMSPRTVKKIFDRFYQADRSLARRTGGCGLGLSIVDFVVRSHGGTIEVESRPGEGSTFTVSLPPGDTPAASRLLEGAR